MVGHRAGDGAGAGGGRAAGRATGDAGRRGRLIKPLLVVSSSVLALRLIWQML
ncbi:MAG: hypothetical protein R3D78_06825 [Paracoccaceae bacterium]